MKKEDLDWWIYHLLADTPDQDIEALAIATGCPGSALADSLARLETTFLIEGCNGRYRIRSMHEMLLSCQAKYDETTPFTIENGIIRERKRKE
ncbi:MAG TPA: MarR family transcriptional regulator [Methanoregulaceae archaeon]|nr:MarR family transcriptional regulator [Methanoregulaceae archaeon]HPH34187.1 MarR family transcriptional regulator [Methanoregulaceae archaeon]HPM61441.1 MarR family transcriptional regulator [Methanoregulaceae archaeon]HQA81201.1 MarR family transcriptional regulator [Methanoregulaceae archaeon]